MAVARVAASLTNRSRYNSDWPNVSSYLGHCPLNANLSEATHFTWVLFFSHVTVSGGKR